MPHLTETEIETTMPTQKRSETFGSYIRKIQNFLAREKIQRRPYTTRQQTLLVLENLHPYYKEVFKTKIQKKLPSHDCTMAPSFQMEMQNLPMTL